MPPRRATSLMKGLARSLFEDEAERARFLEALTAGGSREQSIVVLEDRPEIRAFPRLRPLPWQPDFVVRLAEHFRPAKHSAYARGWYYSFDFSSAFAATPMLAIPERPRRLLDVCAAPGGKAVFAWRALRPELLVANETIRKRAGTLIDNLRRCRVETATVAGADPSVWGRKFPDAFDVVVVDAPCSGQSLLAKGVDPPQAFEPAMIDLCHSRQRRILGNAARCVAPGGHLLYMTCTFAYKENEKVMAWLIRDMPEFSAVEHPPMAEFRSRWAEFPCYRLFPHQGLGAGAFTCLLRRAGDRPAELPLLDGAPIRWRYGEPWP